LKNKKDYNSLITHNKRARKIARRIIHSRVIFTFLLILIQIIVFLLFVLELNSYLEYFFGVSLVLSFIFMIYLANCKGKNEFKIAWMVPLVLFPLFGIAAYVFYQINFGGIFTRRNLAEIKKKNLLPDTSIEKGRELLKKYPKIQGLGNYLLNTSGCYACENNKISYYKNGESFYPDLLEEIKKAKNFIFMEFFIIEIDESWLKILDLLEQKVKEGLQVRILYDALGSIMMSTRSYERYIIKKGIQARSFLPLVPLFSTQLNNRDHRKIIVIDGKLAYTGGLNIKNEYFNYGINRFPYWKDNFIKIEGSAVDSFTQMFFQNWNLNYKRQEDFHEFINRYKKPASKKASAEKQKEKEKGLIIPYFDDAYNKLDIAEEVYAYILNNAKKYVHITTPYFLMDNYLFTTLTNAVRRGVEVSVILPSVADHYLTYCIGKSFVEDAQKEGINIYFYKKGFIHAKTFISDNCTATVGSVNLDYRSLYHHFECGAIIHNHAVVKEIEKDFQETLKDCVLLGSDEYKKIPKKQLAIGRIFRIFSPLM